MTTPTPQCPYCRSRSDLSPQYADQRMTVCRSCGAWFVWPLPTAAAVLEHYHQNVQGMPAELREWRSDTSQPRSYERVARRISRCAAGRRVETIVDVGAGALELTVSLAREFSGARVEAWDLFADGLDRSLPSDVAERVRLQRIDLNQLDPAALPRGSFDVVACVAVIEHLLEPLALLRLLRSIIAPGGFAYVVAPEVTSAAHRILRSRWPYYHPDEHVTLPSMASIEQAVSSMGGTYRLRRTNMHYSLKYLMRFLHVPIPVPAAADLLLSIPAGAFELVWHNEDRRFALHSFP
jgi:SAM-dependent methyltransferase